MDTTIAEYGIEIVSGKEMVEMDVPNIPYYTEGILRPKGKATLVAKEKMGKSFLAIHCNTVGYVYGQWQ